MTSDLKDMYTDLLAQGITEETMKADRDAIIHSVFAEDFLAHVGIEVPDDPDDEWYEAAEDVIAHFGVKGMKWGRRRPRGANGLVVKSGKAEVDSSKVAGAKRPKKESPVKVSSKSSAKSMTTEELNAAIRRIELEQKYRQLTAPTKNAMLSEVQKIAGEALKQNAQKYATQYVGKGVELLIKEGAKQLAKK